MTIIMACRRLIAKVTFKNDVKLATHVGTIICAIFPVQKYLERQYEVNIEKGKSVLASRLILVPNPKANLVQTG